MSLTGVEIEGEMRCTCGQSPHVKTCDYYFKPMTKTLTAIQAEAQKEFLSSKLFERIVAVETMAQVHGFSKHEGETVPDLINSLISSAYQAGKEASVEYLDVTLTADMSYSQVELDLFFEHARNV